MDKDFEWIVDEDGRVHKQIKLGYDLSNILSAQYQRFIDTFGREPGPNDPVFFENYYASDEEEESAMVKALEKIGADPAYIYAYRKTQRLVTEMNISKLSGLELEEWNSAYEEYFERLSDEDEFPDRTIFASEFERCIYMLGMVIQKSGVTEKNEGYFNLRDFAIYCIMKTHKSLRSIVAQLESFLFDDTYSLLRSVYDNYLHLTFVLRNPQKVDDLVATKIGLESGTHMYFQNESGKENRRIIIDKNTGRKLEGHISSERMAKSSEYTEDPLIHSVLFKYLSSYTHPDITVADNYFHSYRVKAHKSNRNVNIYLIGLFLGVTTLERILELTDIDELTKYDIKTFLIQVKPELQQGIDLLNDEKIKTISDTLKARLEYIGVR